MGFKYYFICRFLFLYDFIAYICYKFLRGFTSIYMILQVFLSYLISDISRKHKEAINICNIKRSKCDKYNNILQIENGQRITCFLICVLEIWFSAPWSLSEPHRVEKSA